MQISNYILSFPRSGNHWVRFCIEYLSARPTLGCAANTLDVPIHQNTFPLQQEILSHVSPNSEPIFRKAHYVHEVSNEQLLIFIIRDYKECIPRYASTLPNHYSLLIGHYLSLVEFYEKSTTKRLLIYYEDLIERPASVITKIHEFIGNPNPQYLSQLVDNHDQFRVVNSTATGRRWDGCISNFKARFHWERLSMDEKEHFIEHWISQTSGKSLQTLERYASHDQRIA